MMQWRCLWAWEQGGGGVGCLAAGRAAREGKRVPDLMGCDRAGRGCMGVGGS